MHETGYGEWLILQTEKFIKLILETDFCACDFYQLQHSAVKPWYERKYVYRKKEQYIYT